jgi:hypothetical protein
MPHPLMPPLISSSNKTPMTQWWLISFLHHVLEHDRGVRLVLFTGCVAGRRCRHESASRGAVRHNHWVMEAVQTGPIWAHMGLDGPQPTRCLCSYFSSSSSMARKDPVQPRSTRLPSPSALGMVVAASSSTGGDAPEEISSGHFCRVYMRCSLRVC